MKPKLKQQEELGNTYNSRMEEARKLHETATEALYQEYEQLSQTLHPEYNEKQKAMTALDYQIQMCHKELIRSRTGRAETSYPVVHRTASEQEEPH